MEDIKIQNETESIEKVSSVEKRLTEILPTHELIEIFSEDTFLIGGLIRDLILEKDLSNSDLDLMTRLSKDDVLLNLKATGFTENDSREFEENKYSFNNNGTVIELLIKGRKIQAGFIGSIDAETLIKQGDLTINCCAFYLKRQKILNPEMLDDVLNKRLKFCSPESARKDPWKIFSALKQISRIPDIRIDNETLETIREGIPKFIEFFANNPKEQIELQNIFGNINSQEVLDLFKDFDTKGIFDHIHFIKPTLETSEQYISTQIENLSGDLREEIIKLAKKSFRRRLDINKLFNDKVNSVTYGFDNSGSINACCLIGGERIYAIASKNSEAIVDLAHDLCKHNYNVWCTVSISSKHIIHLAQDAGLKLITNHKIIEKILVNNYPEYSNKIVISQNENYTTFSKKDLDDTEQVLLIS